MPSYAAAGVLGGVILLGVLIWTIFSTPTTPPHQSSFNPGAGYDRPRNWTDESTNTSKQRPIRRKKQLCAICQELLENGNIPKKLPCTHVFHAVCITRWFQEQKTCPTCRREFE